MYYFFFDEFCIMSVVGEFKYINSLVFMYDFMYGFGLDKFIDLFYKCFVFVCCLWECFFQFCFLDENDKVMGGIGVGLVFKF